MGEFVRPPHTVRPKVFGIGLNKTGTTTLAASLRILGYERHSGYRHDLLVHYRNGNLEPIFCVLDAHESFEDWPYPLLYQEIYARYGTSARYILTTRTSADVWLASLKRHALRTDPDSHSRRLAYGFNYPHGYEAEHMAMYEAHQREVLDFFRNQAAENVLLQVCWERGDGWKNSADFSSNRSRRTHFRTRTVACCLSRPLMQRRINAASQHSSKHSQRRRLRHKVGTMVT